MPRMRRIADIADIATLVAGAAVVATAGQVLLMPQIHAWEAEIIAAFMHGPPQ
jgi:hypothetical protein